MEELKLVPTGPRASHPGNRHPGPVQSPGDHGPGRHLDCSLVRGLKLRQSRAPDPRKWCERLHAYCCLKLRFFVVFVFLSHSKRQLI